MSFAGSQSGSQGDSLPEIQRRGGLKAPESRPPGASKEIHNVEGQQNNQDFQGSESDRMESPLEKLLQKEDIGRKVVSHAQEKGGTKKA